MAAGLGRDQSSRVQYRSIPREQTTPEGGGGVGVGLEHEWSMCAMCVGVCGGQRDEGSEKAPF